MFTSTLKNFEVFLYLKWYFWGESDASLNPFLSLCSLLGKDWLSETIARVHIHIEVVHMVPIHIVPELETLMTVWLVQGDLGADKSGLVPRTTGGRGLNVVVVASYNKILF